MHTRRGFMALFLGVWLFSAVRARAQSDRPLTVRVIDQPGGTVAAARVTLFSDERVLTVTADNSGEAVFPAPGHARYLEVSSPGFFSSSVAITSEKNGEILVSLSVGMCPQCGLLVESRDHSVRYEEKGGAQQLIGSVIEFSGPPLPRARLKLMRADADTTDSKWRNRSPSMNERPFNFSFISWIVSDARGEFQLGGLEPGWYSVEVVRDGYGTETAKFWIARQTLTRPARIEMIRTEPGYPSPMKPSQEAAPVPRSPE